MEGPIFFGESSESYRILPKNHLNKFTDPHAGRIIDGAEDHRDDRRTSNFNGGRPFW